ncbi:DUF4276 family protein [Pseudoxanthomonas beigongshangi]
MQPLAPIPQVVAAARGRLDFLRARNVDRVIVAIDRENSQECPGVRAAAIEHGFHRAGYQEVRAVVKNRKLENWLLSDPEMINTVSGFNVSNAVIRQVSSSGSDSFPDASRTLAGSSSRGYSKRRDAVRIAGVSRLDRIESASRSFRRLLRLIGDNRYAHQSQRCV